MKIETLQELHDLFHTGQLGQYTVLVVDNDSTSVWEEGECIFEMHPADLLTQALDLLEIPNAPA